MTTLIIIGSILALIIIAIAFWVWDQKRGAKKFDEWWSTASDDERRQIGGSTQLG